METSAGSCAAANSHDRREHDVRLEKPLRVTEHAWPIGIRPLLSVSCCTYNQKKFLVDALEGFLAQETDFPIEIVVQDDASSDGTTELLLRYASDYPQIVRPVFREENSATSGQSAMLLCIAECRGELIALCEGDDYWTNPRKLQRQVGFLSDNPDFVGCIHDARIVDQTGEVITGSWIRIRKPRYTRRDCIEWLHSDYPTASLVFRRSALLEIPHYLRHVPRDLTLDIAITRHGDLGLVDGVMSDYRVHTGGAWSSSSEIKRALLDFELWHTVIRDEELFRYYADSIHKNILQSRHKLLSASEKALSLKKSFSWKVTKPLRRMRRLFDSADTGKD